MFYSTYEKHIDERQQHITIMSDSNREYKRMFYVKKSLKNIQKQKSLMTLKKYFFSIFSLFFHDRKWQIGGANFFENLEIPIFFVFEGT